MTRLRLTLSIAGLGTALMGALQRNQYMIWIATGLLAASVVLRIVEAIARRRAGRSEPPTEQDGG